MKKQLAAALALAVLPLVALAPHASAAVTRLFPSAACPAGATGLTNCIALSAVGDIVKVKPGTYFENVVVSQDVTVRAADCTRRPVIDATTPAPTNAGPPGVRGIGFSVQADGVTIDCFTVRHATVGVENGTATGFDNVTIRRLVTVDASKGVHSFAGGDNLLVTRSLFRDGDLEGIDIDGGTGVKVITNRAVRMGDDCIDMADVPAALIQGNVLSRCDDGDAIHVSATSPGVQVIGNRASNVDGSAVDVSADDAVIKRNVASVATLSNVFQIFGNNPQVTNNVAIGTSDGEYFHVTCSGTPCDNILIQSNRGLGAAPDSVHGMFVSIAPSLPCGAPPCVRIVGNSIRGAARNGFDLSGNDLLVQGNRSFANGRAAASLGSGFQVTGSGNRFVRNTAAGNAVDGIMFSGNNNIIDENVAFGNTIDGIHVFSGSANTLNGNLSLRNLGEGLENDGTSTSFTNNVSRKNRSDCAGDGTLNVVTGNVCADGSNFTRPGSIEP